MIINVRVSIGDLKIWLAIFFQRVIGCNGYRTENQHKEYTAYSVLWLNTRRMYRF